MKRQEKLGGFWIRWGFTNRFEDCFPDTMGCICCTVFSCYLSLCRMPKSKELVSSSSSASDSDSEVDKKVKIIFSSLLL